MSPCQRSLALMRKEGYVCQVVEYFNFFSKRRVDLFNFIDILCLGGARGIVGVQTTTGSNLSARVKKVLSLPEHTAWLMAGGCIELHGWSKKGKRGKRKLWQVKRVVIK